MLEPVTKTDAHNLCSLQELCGTPMEPGSFLRWSVRITRSLAELHGQNRVHRNIRPDNVFVDLETGAVALADSSMISNPRRLEQSARRTGKIESSLAYMPPEQIGRLNLLVDHRADLYSLGVVFYQMLTGILPFKAADALELVHCHIARLPRRPVDILPSLPPVVSSIVMKLLAKDPDERYQTAMGLEFDLAKCLAQWDAGKDIESFELANKWDHCDRLTIPRKLYGRAQDIDLLFQVFERVLKSGIPELLMITGYSGIGKTSLARELYAPVVRERGRFIWGKFDQYKRDIPYATIAGAFQELVRQILTEREDRLDIWRRRLREALGLNGQLIVDLIPQVERIIGPQPPVPELPLIEAESRFNLVFLRFVEVFARQGHPLVLFLDDLQWADPESLRLMEQIITCPDIGHLLLIGAYRDNEVSPAHPVALMLDRVYRSRFFSGTINLSPLSFEDVNSLTAHTFRSEPARIEPLARLVHEKTAGNPFFVIQFLMALHTSRFVKFDPAEGCWKWDLPSIRARGYADNVVELMVGKLRDLSPQTQKNLMLASCIGNRFDLATLAVINETSLQEARRALSAALEEGLLVPETRSRYAFLHDRVQQAAYSLIAEENPSAVHLRIARLLLARTPPEDIEEKVFDIVNQFNLGLPLIGDPDERYRAAELNLIAGRKAKASTAYVSALNYLSTGVTLLDHAAWTANYQLAFDLYKELAEVEYLNANYAHSKELIDVLISKARSNLEKAKLYRILIIVYTITSKYSEAIEYGRMALSLLDVYIPEKDLDEALNIILANTKRIIGTSKISSLVNQPEITDIDKRTVIEILSELMVPARYSNYILFQVLTVITVQFSLKYGAISKSPIGYSAYGMLLSSTNNYREAYEFGELALKLSERFNDLAQKCRACFILGHYLNHWVKHLNYADDFNNEAYRAGLASAELQWAGYTLAYKLFPPFYRGAALAPLRAEIPSLLLFTRKNKNEWATDTLLGFQLALSRLEADTSSSPMVLFDHNCDREYLEQCREHRSFGAMGRYAVLKAQLLYLYGRPGEALKAASMAGDLVGFFSSSISVAALNFYHSLILAALHDHASEQQKIAYADGIRTNQKSMRTWVDNCEENFNHQYLLVEAELARIGGEEMEAGRLYEQSIQSARENGFIQNEGMACELASRFYQHHGLKTVSDVYLRKAGKCYAEWGARGKLQQLESQHPWLLQEGKIACGGGPDAPIGHLDAMSVVKASQAISSEIVLSSLLETLMRTMVENAGARTGSLILTHGDGLTVAATASVEETRIEVMQPGPPLVASALPLSILNYVAHTEESVILSDASAQNMFSSDEYLLNNRPLSVMCLPLLHQAKLIGMLYLENSLIKGAFTTGRIAVLEVLAAQAAVSLENAALYLERSRTEAALRESEQKYRTIFENSGTAIIYIEDDMTISMCNKEFEKLSGYTRTELEGKMKWTGFVANPDELERMKRYHSLRRVHPEEVPQTYEFQFVDREGKRREAMISVTVMPGKKQSQAAVLDITERKRAGEERARLVTAIEQAAEAVIITDANFIIEYVNPAFERISGFGKSEIIGLHSRILKSGSHDETFYRKIEDTLSRGEVWAGRLTSKKKDGTFYEAEVTSSPVRDQSGATINYVSIHRDITQEVKLEMALRQAHKMEALGTLAGGIAHDFNNILMAIIGYTEIVHFNFPEESAEKHQLEQVLKAAFRAKDLVRQILAFSRLDELERKPVQIVSIVREALELLRSSLPSTIEIREDLLISSQESVVLADSTQIHQVLMNLATNAAHAMRLRGGVLSVSLSAVEDDVFLVFRHPDRKTGPFLRLTVSDTGQGIEPEVMERIFDPYFTTKGTGEGSGMGLAVVQGIVRSHGGMIEVFSEPGKGSSFHVYLPRSEAKAPEKENTFKDISGGCERILFVDDEEFLASLGKEILEPLGYSVTVITSSSDALEIFRANPGDFDLVITDMTMPTLTGMELSQKIMALRPGMPIILCSGFSDLITGTRAKELGIREFIMKPYDIGGFTKTIRRVLDGG
jgi:PAS domain S-box-containing protein